MRTSEHLIKIFEQCRLPLSEVELRNKLEVNKTTIYRALEQLKAKNLIREIEFGEGFKRFELNSSHHHHLVCTNCQNVDEIEIPGDIAKIEKQITRQKRFKIINHSLEFLGLCSQCS